ncbi:hypothetical protein HPP92_011135 [Vanilla planifolia]|uniref:Uncharacterized protein n=1 Tax=Vanilla planifolia TaxID=51239 RepID=A0A835R057_VANPL|nr:hypothetical protein HPP92_011135 [Vanilla planifolia]
MDIRDAISPYASPLFLLLFLFLFLLLHMPPFVSAIDVGIGIGIGIGGSPEPEPGQSPGPSGATPTPAEPQPCEFVNQKQYEAYKVIQRFKKTITCDPKNVLSTWVGYRPCNYRGFYCGTPPGLKDTPTIASVDFNGFRLCAPTLVGFLDSLPDLALFHANSNNFSSTLPLNLSALPFLYELDVSNNNLSGPFPAAVLPLFRLRFLDIRFNHFAGLVSPSVFNLGLQVLFLNDNSFNQPLPAELGKSPVSYLTLADNGFTGPIPKSICNTSNTLIQVLFLNNRLSGCLPSEIGQLKKATVFDAGKNQLTGPIPYSFGCLHKVEQLNLAINQLYGCVPDVVCQLYKNGRLLNLSLSYNFFTEVGPSCVELIKKGVLDVRQNCIPGQPDQRPPWECSAFRARCKYCPVQEYMPCINQKVSNGVHGVVLPGAATATAYNSYTALQPGDGPH